MNRNCTNCRHAATKDVGYSDYTVEGTNFDCLESLNPEIDKDGESWESYEDHNMAPYNFAEECSTFRESNREPQHYCVEEKMPLKEKVTQREYDEGWY